MRVHTLSMHTYATSIHAQKNSFKAQPNNNQTKPSMLLISNSTLHSRHGKTQQNKIK